MVPKDKIEHGCGMRCWVHVTLYGETRMEVEAKRKLYFGEYPTEGYDTHTKGPIAKEGDYFYVEITRWSTCD